MTGEGGNGGKGAGKEGKNTLADSDLVETTPGDTDPIATALAWYAAHADRTLTAIVEPGLDQDDRRRPTAAQLPDHATEVAATTPSPAPKTPSPGATWSWRTW